jgi:hypothetical protein
MIYSLLVAVVEAVIMVQSQRKVAAVAEQVVLEHLQMFQ